MSDLCLEEEEVVKPEVLLLKEHFGSVQCGKEVNKTFQLKNNGELPVCYTIAHEYPECDRFIITPKEIQVPPGKVANFKVNFKSFVAGNIYEKRYAVSDGTNIVAEFSVSCLSLGPAITPGHVAVKFHVPNERKSQTKRIELENKSICPTIFHFERPGMNQPFEISQNFGEIQGNAKIVLEIKFAPTKLGIYCKRVHCMFLYHPPVLFTLIGVCNSSLSMEYCKFDCRQFANPLESYESFMENMRERSTIMHLDSSDTTGRSETIDIFGSEKVYNNLRKKELEEMIPKREKSLKPILSHYYYNFENKSPPIKRIKLINDSLTKEFYFEWSHENGKHFSVSPKSGNLKEGQNLDFTIQFAPDMPDRLFTGVLDIRIFTLNLDDSSGSDRLNLPKTSSLDLIGHSFSNNCASWLVQCEVEPSELFLSACTPGETAYSTLLIRRFGHLPSVYEFIPPKKSVIKIKPPLGFIADSYQLFVVKFEAPIDWEGTYVETWKISYNSSKFVDKLKIITHIEKPRIIFGETNTFKFPTSLPGRTHKTALPLTNFTRLNLLYEFKVPKNLKWIHIPVPQGKIGPLESTNVDVIFKPTRTKEYRNSIFCLTKSETKQDYVVQTDIQLLGSCQDGFLVAMPAFHNFGKCIYGKEIKKKFTIFNFTPVVMHFQLFVVNELSAHGDVSSLVNIKPKRGSIMGKKNIEAEVTVFPRILEMLKFYIHCNLSPLNSHDAAHSTNSRTIFTMQLEAVLPTYQIIDLKVDSGGPLMNPDWIWKMMNIKGINKALRTTVSGEDETVTVRMPEASVGSPNMTIFILIEAGPHFPVSCQVSKSNRKHVPKKYTTIISQHTGLNEVVLSPTSFHLEPGEREIIKLEMKFNAVGSTYYEWSFFLSLDRLIVIRGALNGLPNSETPQLSLVMHPEITLKPVFIGDLNPPIQLFWMYNNTPKKTSYVLDKRLLREASDPFPRIFNCLNASGILPPYSCLPLMFRFAPNELREYQVSTCICLKDVYVEDLIMTGSGLINYSRFSEFSHEETIPEISLLKNCGSPLEPSVRVFTIKPFSTYSCISRIFFLENLSEDKVWAYNWHSFSVDNLISAVVEPKCGSIQPGQKILVELLVRSYGLPTNITFSIPCDVIDYTTLQRYEKALQQEKEIGEMCQDYFIITEKGTTNKVPPVDIPKKPNQNHVFITVRTNIVANDSLDAKLYVNELMEMQRGLELSNYRYSETSIREEIAVLTNEVVERIIWRILNSEYFAKILANYSERCGNVNYSQILLGNDKAIEKIEKHQASVPKYLMQSIIENLMLEIIYENYGIERDS